MAFTDPQSITIAGVTTPLPRVNSGNNGSEYLSSDGLLKLSASSAYGRRIRRVLRVDKTKVAADPLTSNNTEVSSSIYLVVDEPKWGFTNQELLDVYTGFNSLYTATSHALITKLLGGES